MISLENIVDLFPKDNGDFKQPAPGAETRTW